MAEKSKYQPDPREGHVRLYWEVVDSPAWKALSWAERGLYVAIRRKLNGKSNGNVQATLAGLRDQGVTSAATLAKGLRAFIALGLLAKTRQGGVANGGRVCCLYRFTDEEAPAHLKQRTEAFAATNEWKAIVSEEQAAEVLDAAHRASRRPQKNKGKVQQLNRVSSISESETPSISSIPEPLLA